MILQQPNALVYLRRDNLIVAGKHIAPAKLAIPPELIHNLEVRDADKFVTLCQDFFAGREVTHKQVIVVLDTSVVFAKSASLADQDNSDVIADDFVAMVPFGPDQRVCVQFEQNKQLQLYATNARLYFTIIEALRRCGAGKIIAVTPAAAYQIGDTNQSGAAIDIFLSSREIRRKLNFLDVTPL